MKVLFVKLSSIGDIIHTLPSLAAVKRALPSLEAHWVVERRSAEILRNNRLLDGLIEIDTKALRRGRSVIGKLAGSALGQYRALRASGPDLSIDFQGLLKSGAIGKLSGARSRIGFDRRNLREPASAVLYTDRITVDPFQNVIFKNLDLAEGALRRFLGESDFTLDRELVEFPIDTTDDDKQEARAVAERAGGDFAILNPGGGWVTKLWRAKDYGKLADLVRSETGLIPVVSTGPGEDALAEAVQSAASDEIVHARLGLKGFYELARMAKIYVGGDTGPTHLAVAAGCPVVGIFGPTEWWRNGSVRQEDVCVARKELECRINCHRRSCGKWLCMDIEPETVFAAMMQRLEAARSPEAENS